MPIRDLRIVPFASSDMIQRSFVWTLLEFNGQEIEVFVTHLSHLPHPNEIRQEQVAELTAAISQSRRPWILMGDFNALPSGPEIAALMEISSPVFAQQPELLAEESHPAQNPKMRIDYIFFSGHFELLGQEVVDNGATSDHRPIRSRLRLTTASAP
jgi:endonuclease/exonuclease/phosphatase family metal-dependent hydrolase